jgi:twinkle protein
MGIGVNSDVAIPLVIVSCEAHRAAAIEAGASHVACVDIKRGGEQVMAQRPSGDPGLAIGYDYRNYILALPAKCGDLRDDIAVRLGDEKCKWVDWPFGGDVAAALASARPMWTDEIARLNDIPDPGVIQTYSSGFPALDQHGFCFQLPAFMSIIGPYGSGKSVLLRQLLVNLRKRHGWRCLLTSFEEKVKPRYLRDLRRHFLEYRIHDAEERDIARIDAEINEAFVFLRRKRNTVLDLDRLLNRIEFAVRVYGVRVVAIDPVNEIDHQVPKGESKSDYMGRFIMQMKALADDYNLLIICCAHPPKDGVEKRLSRCGLLTLNDGADTAHWGNKSDIGWCVWRNLDGPTYLHIDKLKDHETMGQPTLAELHMERELNRFRVTRVGYDILGRADQ